MFSLLKWIQLHQVMVTFAAAWAFAAFSQALPDPNGPPPSGKFYRFFYAMVHSMAANINTLRAMAKNGDGGSHA